MGFMSNSRQSTSTTVVTTNPAFLSRTKQPVNPLPRDAILPWKLARNCKPRDLQEPLWLAPSRRWENIKLFQLHHRFYYPFVALRTCSVVHQLKSGPQFLSHRKVKAGWRSSFSADVRKSHVSNTLSNGLEGCGLLCNLQQLRSLLFIPSSHYFLFIWHFICLTWEFLTFISCHIHYVG